MNTNELEHRSEAYRAGFKAREDDVSREGNPYAAGTIEADEWFAGWDDATPGT